MRIYLTSSWNNRERMRWLTVWLEKQGHTVVSTWYERDYPADAPRDWWAAIDLSEIERADALAMMTDGMDDSCHGSMDFEAGFAFALGKKLYWIGAADARNIFMMRYAERWGAAPASMPKPAVKVAT